MEGVFTWVKHIACFTILTTVIIHILPSNKYEKYLKLYLGLLLILLMISPFAKLFHLDKVMEEFFQKENLKMEMGDMAFELELKEASQYEKLTEEYEKELQVSVGNFLEEKGYYLRKADIIWEMDLESENFGSIKNMDLVVSKTPEGKEEISIDKVVVSVFESNIDSEKENFIKNELGCFYNLSEDNINVSIQGGGKK